MKKFLVLLSLLFTGFAYADTINLHWLNEDGSIYQNSTCVIDSDLILPATPPTRYGYTFTGWKFSNYTPIEYLESTGTQYIDTEYVPNQNTGIKTKVVFNSVTNDEAVVFGSGANFDSRVFETYTWGRKLQFSYNNNYVGSLYTFSIGDIVVINWNKNIVDYSVNGIDQQQIAFSYGSFTSPYQARMFSITRPQTINNTTAIGKIKIYYFQIYDNDVLVRDFIPVLDYNGIPCMFDKVEGKYYYNQGTGQFIAGPTL